MTQQQQRFEDHPTIRKSERRRSFKPKIKRSQFKGTPPKQRRAKGRGQ